MRKWGIAGREQAEEYAHVAAAYHAYVAYLAIFKGIGHHAAAAAYGSGGMTIGKNEHLCARAARHGTGRSDYAAQHGVFAKG